MRRSISILVLLVVCAFCLSLSLGQSLDNWTQGKARKGDFMELLLGDSRKLIGQYLFTKADIYFHSGFYISQFEHPKSKGHEEENHMAGETEEEHEEHMREAAKYQPRDWIEAFGRKFYPTTHTHLDQGGSDNGKEGVAEIMPWLKMSADLDPNRIETYTVAAYWLTQRLKKPKQAEQFLREGLRANPGNPALLYELSRLAGDVDHDSVKERNLLELALRRWQEQESGKEEPNEFLLEEIYAHLAQVEASTGNYARAIQYFGKLRPLSPHPETIDQRIAELKEKMASSPTGVQ